MMNRKIIASLQAVTLCVFLISQAHSEDITIVGTMTQTIKTPVMASSFKTRQLKALSTSPSKEKEIQLLLVHLSSSAKRHLEIQLQTPNTTTEASSIASSADINAMLPSKINLGMNNVPMLDQGIHGSCVTFAATAAIDAVLNRGDYISQLCQLQLGNYIEHQGYTLSGWEGANGSNVLSQIENFGIVSKANQRSVGCGGLTEYPTYRSVEPDSFITPEQFHQISEPLYGREFMWSSVLDPYGFFAEHRDPTTTLNYVKKSLASGDRLIFSVLLPMPDVGRVGAVGNYKSNVNDTWVLTPAIREAFTRVLDSTSDNNDAIAAHEMIIIGYDDNAIARDNSGTEHRGLLFLRNSWGAGQGDFYMSYDYFKLLTYDAQRIVS